MKSWVWNSIKRLGWLLLLAGLVPLGIQAFDHSTTERATAQVVGIENYCKPASCSTCRYRRSTCLTASGSGTRTADLKQRRYVRLAFATREGRTIAARARFSLLELAEPKIGEVMTIRYRTDHPTRVRPDNPKRLTMLGLLVAAVGLVILGLGRLGRLFGRGVSRAATDRPIELQRAMREHAARSPWGQSGAATVSAAWGHASGPSEPSGSEPVRSTPKAHGANRPKVAVATRQHKQGRNRGWFG
ncbi:MAG: hypothetical protein R3D67_12055 [Hyphomicrobiaceae bacterium]